MIENFKMEIKHKNYQIIHRNRQELNIKFNQLKSACNWKKVSKEGIKDFASKESLTSRGLNLD